MNSRCKHCGKLEKHGIHHLTWRSIDKYGIGGGRGSKGIHHFEAKAGLIAELRSKQP